MRMSKDSPSLLLLHPPKRWKNKLMKQRGKKEKRKKVQAQQETNKFTDLSVQKQSTEDHVKIKNKNVSRQLFWKPTNLEIFPASQQEQNMWMSNKLK